MATEERVQAEAAFKVWWTVKFSVPTWLFAVAKTAFIAGFVEGLASLKRGEK